MRGPLERLLDNSLGSLHDGQLASQELLVRGDRDDAHLGVDIVEVLHGQLGGWHLVEPSNLVQDVDGLLLLSTTDEVLGRLVEVENEESDDEDQEGDTTENTAADPPSVVATRGTARRAVGDLGTSRKWRFGCGTSVLWDCAKGDSRGDDDTDGLPHGKQREEISTVLRQKLEGCERTRLDQPRVRYEEMTTEDSLMVASIGI